MDIMVLGSQQRRQIEEIISSTDCSKKHQCYTSGFQRLCKVMSFAGGQMIECMDPPDSPCGFRTAFGWGHVCTCPVRRHIAEKYRR